MTSDNEQPATDEKTKVPDERLRMLFDYTVFHIGVYLTLGGSIIAAEGFFSQARLDQGILRVVLVLLATSGALGGLIASNIFCLPTGTTYEDYMQQSPDGLFGFPVFLKAQIILRLEHLFFWVAIFLLCWAFWSLPSVEPEKEKAGQSCDQPAWFTVSSRPC